MQGFKEFQGKDLDAAIREACDYYAVPREKLEIDIIQDAKSGIFGIVGARKAKIQARRAHLREAVVDILGRSGGLEREEPAMQAGSPSARENAPVAADAAPVATAPRADAPAAGAPQAAAEEESSAGASACAVAKARAPRERQAREERPRRQPRAGGVADGKESETEGGDAEAHGGERPRRVRSRRRPERPEPAALPDRPERAEGRPSRVPESGDDGDDSAQEGFRMVPLSELDGEVLQRVTLEVVSRLVSPLVDEVNLQVELGDNRVNVMLDCGDASGLLIGREGQTLASLQYLISRIVSRKMDAAVRVHLDAGEYRQRQDEKLRDMALALAERVRASGRSCSTRPLSSYHRRIVHLTLQDMDDIQTRSSGEGGMKRVVVIPRKKPAA